MGLYPMKLYEISIRRVCLVLSICRSMWYYQSIRDDGEVIEKLTEQAEKHPTTDFWIYQFKMCQSYHPKKSGTLCSDIGGTSSPIYTALTLTSEESDCRALYGIENEY